MNFSILMSFAGSVNPFKVHFALMWSVWKS